MFPKQKILINLMGTGYDIWCGELPERMRGLPAMEIVEAIQGQSAIVVKRKNKAKEIHPVENDFKNFLSYRGPNLLELGQMEIWINRKRIYTYKFQELADSATLFPIFKVKSENIIITGDNYIISGLQEKGYLAQYSLETENFSVDQLQLNTLQLTINNKPISLLHQFTFHNRDLKVKWRDTAVTGLVWEETLKHRQSNH
ncbi:MAG: hypothetical protein IPP51_16700 [Bacteroidetes bacterium]|nr:hypothetical protein [Bacteroidota bacterium]